MEESIEEKQLYLRTEIIMNGYDAQDFSIFLANLKGEEKVDLEYWSLDEIQKAVETYKKTKLIEKEETNQITKEETNLNIDKNKKKIHFFKVLKRRQSSVEPKRKQLKLEDNTDEKNKNINKKKIKKEKNFKKISNKELKDDDNDNDNIVLDFDIILSGKKKNKNKYIFFLEEKEENKILCEKLEKNELTERNDLIIVVSSPTKVKKKMFVNSMQYIIETNPIGFKTSRELKDFEYLYEKLPLINSKVYNPILISNYLKKDSNKQILALNLYINAIIERAYFRSLPIIYDFLTLSLEDWEKAKIEKYDKIKEAYNINQIKNLKGYFNLEIKPEDKEYFLKIKEDINHKTEAFNKFNNAMEGLLDIMEKMSFALKNLKNSFADLKNKYKNKKCTNYFANLEIIVQEWGEGYIKQKNYLNDELKYFFKYMDKENNAFLKFYENFKSNFETNKSKYEKFKKNNFQTEKDKETFKNIKKEIKFNISNAKEEYEKLNIRQASRIENLLFKCSIEKEDLFNDIHNFSALLNAFNERREQEKKFLENQKKLNKEKNNDNTNLEKNNNNNKNNDKNNKFEDI